MMLSLRLKLLTLVAVASALATVACSEGVPSANLPSVGPELPARKLESQTDQNLNGSARLFRGDPTDITLEDVALVLAIVQAGELSPEALASVANSLLGSNQIEAADLDPVPDRENSNFFLGSPEVTLESVAIVLAALQLPAVDRTQEEIASIATALLGLPPDQAIQPEQVRIPGLLPVPTGLIVNTAADNDPDGEDTTTCTLREAIVAHNTDAEFGGCAAPEGTIAFDPALNDQTIVISGSALPVITRSVTIEGLGQDRLTISGNNQFRVFEIAGADRPEVTIQDLTLTQGLVIDEDGGSIRSNSPGMLTVERMTISDSTATGSFPNGRGGGIFALTATVRNSTLSDNRSERYGGGILANSVTVSNSKITSNFAFQSGGGISAVTATVNTSTISGNSAEVGGGGIRADSATVSNSTISGNSAGYSGGGLYVTNVEVSNITISSNSAGRRNGGGLFARTATVSSSTITGNSADEGGGIHRYGTGSFLVNNSIVAGNTNAAGTVANDIDGNFTSGAHNLIGDAASAGGLTNGVDGNIVGVPNISTVLDTSLAANDTTISAGDPNAGQEPVLTHALVTGSRAIGAGNNFFIPIGVTTDQRGLPRIVNGTVDIGAFEMQ